ADHNPLDIRMNYKRACGDPRPAANHEHGARLGVHQGRDVTEHPLQSHVVRHTGCLHFAADVEGAGQVQVSADPNSDGGAHSFSRIDDDISAGQLGDVA